MKYMLVEIQNRPDVLANTNIKSCSSLVYKSHNHKVSNYVRG